MKTRSSMLSSLAIAALATVTLNSTEALAKGGPSGMGGMRSFSVVRTPIAVTKFKALNTTTTIKKLNTTTVRDHRQQNTVVRDHRLTNVVVRDHRHRRAYRDGLCWIGQRFREGRQRQSQHHLCQVVQKWCSNDYDRAELDRISVERKQLLQLLCTRR